MRIHLPLEKLSGYDLHDFRLGGSLLFRSDLTEAKLSGAKLSDANLSKADLSWAKLLEADLSWAKLLEADLSKTNLSGAKLLDSIIINCISSGVIVNTSTDFSNAIIDNPDFLKLLREKRSQNTPNEIRNKQELRGELLKRNVTQHMIDYYLSLSQLPEN